MCGRFALITPEETLAEHFGLQPPPATTATSSTSMASSLIPRYNIAPTQPVVAVRRNPESGARELAIFRWGLIPSWSKDMKIGSRLINARSETVAEKPSFRAAFKYRRCLIPADGFYEWQQINGRKQPVYIHGSDGKPLALAGLWETWHAPDSSPVESCTILTTEPNELVAPIHNRMPVVIEPPDYEMWLDPGPRPQEGLHLLRPYPSQKLAAYAVSTHVNSPANDDAQCIEPL